MQPKIRTCLRNLFATSPSERERKSSLSKAANTGGCGRIPRARRPASSSYGRPRRFPGHRQWLHAKSNTQTHRGLRSRVATIQVALVRTGLTPHNYVFKKRAGAVVMGPDGPSSVTESLFVRSYFS